MIRKRELKSEINKWKLNQIKIDDIQEEFVLFHKWVLNNVSMLVKREIKMCPEP